MVEITIGDDDGPPPEYQHVYEHDEDGTPLKIRNTSEAPPSVDDVARDFDRTVEGMSWILTTEIQQNDASSKTPTAVPCDGCDTPIWTVREKAAAVQFGPLKMRCGDCSESSVQDNGDEASRE